MKKILIKISYALYKTYKKPEADLLLDELLKLIFG